MSRSRGLWLAASTSPDEVAAGDVFEAMLDGWRDQQLARSLRSYQLAVGSFCDFVCDPAYGWSVSCTTQFGTAPSQVCRPENLASHTSEYEGRPQRRSLTRVELQSLFDAADDDVCAIRSRSKKGWAPAFRDATMLKVAYGWGLRRREVRMLETNDLGSNPSAPEFGTYGVCQVRWGKAAKGGPPRRRSVLTVFGWSTEVLAEWVEDVWPTLGSTGTGLWPSERGPLVSEDRINAAFTRSARAAGLPGGLTLHCLRHSYVTHLIEDGFDASTPRRWPSIRRCPRTTRPAPSEPLSMERSRPPPCARRHSEGPTEGPLHLAPARGHGRPRDLEDHRVEAAAR